MTANFDPATFLDVADGLLNATDAASVRTAVSRAYYAVYAVLRTKTCEAAGHNVFGNKGKHTDLVFTIKGFGTPVLQSVASPCTTLLHRRVTSDYKYAGSVTHDEAVRSVKSARNILTKITHLDAHAHFRAIARELS